LGFGTLTTQKTGSKKKLVVEVGVEKLMRKSSEIVFQVRTEHPKSVVTGHIFWMFCSKFSFAKGP
jgi:acyl-CoA thioesterase FadM